MLNHNQLVYKQTLNYLAKLVLWVIICMVHLTLCYYQVTHAFQSESKLFSCLYVKELLDQKNHEGITCSTHLNQGTPCSNHLVNLTKVYKLKSRRIESCCFHLESSWLKNLNFQN